MKLKYYLIGHGKIDTGKIASGKPYATKGNIIHLRCFEIAIIKITIYKSDRLKGAIGKIAKMKRTVFKFFVLDIGF
ncbi:hypothetical protein GCM10011508_15850 [Flavobacterium lutivivi]|nr:hypothetical protein GCM10011508_15850 [Flavobacterium lutivivi]